MAERRVALVRALNVGGTGLLKMERLRKVAEGLGWTDVTTLGASGNVLYTAGRSGPPSDAKRLAAALTAEMGGRPATVIVRSHHHLQTILKNKPFANVDPAIPTKWWFVGLLAAESEGPLPPIVPGAPIAYARRLPREVCWTMSAPDRRAIDHPKRIEKALGVPMTVRNWKVVNELAKRLGPAA